MIFGIMHVFQQLDYEILLITVKLITALLAGTFTSLWSRLIILPVRATATMFLLTLVETLFRSLLEMFLLLSWTQKRLLWLDLPKVPWNRKAKVA